MVTTCCVVSLRSPVMDLLTCCHSAYGETTDPYTPWEVRVKVDRKKMKKHHYCVYYYPEEYDWSYYYGCYDQPYNYTLGQASGFRIKESANIVDAIHPDDRAKWVYCG